jgi:hypothetical protein
MLWLLPVLLAGGGAFGASIYGDAPLGASFTSLSGHLTSTGAGIVTLADPHRVYTSTVNLTNTTIVGSAAGDLAHTDGVQLAAAPGAGKLVVVDLVLVDYTRVTASYGGGNTCSSYYLSGAGGTKTIIQQGYGAAQTFADVDSSNEWVLGPAGTSLIADSSATSVINASVVLHCTGAFTDPGTAAGTAVVTTVYRIVTQ